MGVYAMGMEMPTTCRKCGFYHHSVDYGYYDFEYCGANNQEFNNAYDSTKPHINPFEEKLSGCPLVCVPPHGRLIDADALTVKLQRHREYHSDDSKSGAAISNGIGQCLDIINGKECTTIIPAEEATP